jgi:hypothetical protein
MNKLPLVTGALLAAGLVSANAQNVYRLTGSTAYRANVNAALKAGTGIFDNSAGTQVIGTAYSASAPQLVFSNLLNGTATYIKTSFTGSEAGIAALGNNAVDNTQPPNPAANLPGTPKPVYLDTATGLTANDSTSNSDIAMADTSALVSLTVNNGAVDRGICGVVQFTWMKGLNNGQAGWSDLVNVTVPVLNVLLKSGAQDESFVTGLQADVGTTIGIVGRNKGSGTRVNTLIETLYANTANATVKQYAMSPVYTAGVLQVPAATVTFADGGWTPINNDGFDSGGGVKNTMLMSKNGGATPTIIPIGYIGLNDANGVQAITVAAYAISGGPPNGPTIANAGSVTTGGTSQYLSLNGVAYSDEKISNGSYDFWGHEHVLTGPNTQAGAVSVATNIKNQAAALATGGLNGYPYVTTVGTTQTMFVDRPGGADTGFVSP